jgi:polyisoprenoid-binding protein YceI
VSFRAIALRALTAIASLSILGATGVAAQATQRSSSKPAKDGTHWVIDPVHSQVDFRVRHMVGRVRGTFDSWYGIIVTNDRDWTRGTVNVTVNTRSVNTGNKYRDADLRGVHFFAADSFPTMTFESTGIVATDSTVEIGGLLTLKGQTRHVVLTGQYRGIGRDRDGRERIAFDGTTAIDRREFGMSYNELVDGALAIGDEAEITLAFEAVRVN